MRLRHHGGLGACCKPAHQLAGASLRLAAAQRRCETCCISCGNQHGATPILEKWRMKSGAAQAGRTQTAPSANSLRCSGIAWRMAAHAARRRCGARAASRQTEAAATPWRRGAQHQPLGSGWHVIAPRKTATTGNGAARAARGAPSRGCAAARSKRGIAARRAYAASGASRGAWRERHRKTAGIKRSLNAARRAQALRRLACMAAATYGAAARRGRGAIKSKPARVSRNSGMAAWRDPAKCISVAANGVALAEGGGLPLRHQRRSDAGAQQPHHGGAISN